MKIKIYSPSHRPGIGDYTDALHEQLLKFNKNIKIISNNNPLTPNPFYFINASLRSGGDLLHIQFNTDLFGKIGKINGPYIYLYFFLAKVVARKIITTIHDIPSLMSYSWLNKTFIKFLYFPIFALSKKIIVHTEEGKERLLAYGANPQKITIISIGIDPRVQILNSKKCKAQLNLTGKKILLIWGFVRASKRYEDVIKILPYLDNRVMLLIAGPVRTWWENYYNSLRKLAQKLGVEKRIIFENRMIPESEVPVYFGASDLALFPYTDITQSAALSQGFAYLKPILTSDIRSFEEIKQQFNCIETYSFTNSDDLVFKINKILNNKNFQKILIKNTKKFLEKTNWNQIAKQTYQAYYNLISRK